MRAILVSALLVAVLAACGDQGLTAAGYVIDVQSTSLTQVESFTVRTPAGAEMLFKVGRLDLTGGAFPAGHLREHMALVQPVAVGYREDSGEYVAYRLTDAPWLQQ